jgi:DNA-binding transcriptional ArsR family regulator
LISPKEVRVATATEARAGQRSKKIEDVVPYALGHRIRVLILMILNQGIYTAGELADIIDEPLNRVSNHVRELVDGGSIEIADTQARRGTYQHYYRAVEIPFYSEKEIEEMPWQQRQVTAGLVIQTYLAEVLAGLRAGKMADDPRAWLVWDRYNLDEEGRREVADEQADHWRRLEAIKGVTANRVAASGDDTVPYIVSVLGFERALKAPKPSHSANGDRRTSAD